MISNTDEAIELIKNKDFSKDLLKYIAKERGLLIMKCKNVDISLLRELYKYDFQENGNDMSIIRKNFYSNFFTPEDFFPMQLDAAFEKQDLSMIINIKDQAIPFIRHSIIDTKEKEEKFLDKLNEMNFNQDPNIETLSKSAALLYYYLTNKNFSSTVIYELFKTQSQQFGNADFFYSSTYCSDELLKKLAKSLNVFKNKKEFGDLDYLETFNNLPIAFAAIKAKKLSWEDFSIKLHDIANTETHQKFDINSIAHISQLARERKKQLDEADLLKLLVKSNIYINETSGIAFQLKQEELTDMIKIIKNINPPLMIVGPILLTRYQDKFKEAKVLSPKDIKALNLNTGRTPYSKIDVNSLLMDLNWKKTPPSLEQAIRNIKDKKMTELTIEESNIILAYAQKLLSIEGINDGEILFTHQGLSEKYGGITNGLCIDLSILPNWSVEDLIYVVHHEVSHAIQNYHSMNMNVDKDEDLLSYAKDVVLRLMNEDYYTEQYYSQSFEFDADFKAYLMSNKLFVNLETKRFDAALSKYKDLQRDYEKTYQRKDKDKSSKTLNELFNQQFKELFKDTDKTQKIVTSIRKNFPILEYEYDLQTGEEKTMEQLLVDLNNNKDDDKISCVIKHIINYRCDANKVGEEKAIENKKALERLLPIYDLKLQIEETKSTYDKYSNYFSALQKNLNNISIVNQK